MATEIASSTMTRSTIVAIPRPTYWSAMAPIGLGEDGYAV
jgi:hypothetical protein